MLNHWYISIIAPIFFFYTQALSAQTSVANDIKHGWELSKRTLLEPLQNKTQTAVSIAFLTVGTGIIITQDGFINQAIRKSPTDTKKFLSTYVGEPFGNPIFHASLIGGTYITSKILKNKRYTDKSVKALTALTFSGVSVQLLKIGFARARPYTNEDQYQFFDNYFEGADYLSFPSGHTIMAFTFASSTTYLFPNQKWIPYVVYPLACVTAWSRMYDNKHWASDVVIAAVLGHFIGKSIAQHEDVKIGVAANSFGGWGLNATISF